jgi:dipeptidyl aminopeptidase/acylaminoacyl peptidase
MDAQKAGKVGYSKALIALVAGVSCFLIYVLACIVSPVSWSPDYSKIAILVTLPFEAKEAPDKCAIFTYDIATGEHVLLDEVEKDGLLSAPSWSPDGKWIAYYRVEPNLPREVVSSSGADPNVGSLTSKVAAEEVAKPEGSAPTAEDLFSEENMMLPPVLFEIAREELNKEEKKHEFFDVKLMLVKPDGTERKVLRVMESESDENHKKTLMFMRPEWTKDCKHLFYDRMIGSGDSGYIGSLEIDTGKMYAHLFGLSNFLAVSPDGNWVASLLEAGKAGREKALLTLARVDGNFHKYFRLDINLPEGTPAYSAVTWFPDSKHLLIGAKKGFRIMAADTGEMEKYRDPNESAIIYPVFSATGNTLYYLAVCEANEPNSPKKSISFKSMNLVDKKAQTVFILSDVPDLDSEGVGVCSISSDGKRVIMRAVIRSAGEKDRSVLLFWDGKTRKVVETDRWLMKPLYTDENLTFEKKLVGKWRTKDGKMMVCEEVGEKTYKIILTEENGEEQRYGANLVNVKGIKLLGVFFDESLAQKKGSDNSHLIPDFFVRIDQIKPKLLIKRMDYKEVAEMLKKDAESLKQMVGETADMLEFERISGQP